MENMPSGNLNRTDIRTKETNGRAEKDRKEQLTIGILAHVDAGKTTLSESLLYQRGSIRTMGRVDHKDAFLDNNVMERERGITIFSKQACFESVIGGRARVYTLLDTPGHSDFSPEMERVLKVLDYAVLVISAADGVNGQVRTLWRLLQHYEVPVFIFVNKMDQPGSEKERLMDAVRRELSLHTVDFGEDLDGPEQQENLAICDDELLDGFFDGKSIGTEEIRALIRERKLFPVFFGSALKNQGVEELIEGMDRYALEPARTEAFGARVFKITRDESGTRLTWMKMTGGRLKVKDVISYEGKGAVISGGSGPDMEDGPEQHKMQEKIEQIRLYSGEKYRPVSEAEPGMICAVAGLSATWAGQGLGNESAAQEEILQPVMTSRIILPPGEDRFSAYRKLRLIEEEEPMLHISYDEEKREISAQVMGQVQREILKRIIFERFGLCIEFGRPGIVYKETIRNTVEGVGHFEPLRHYAEVHLLLEPGEPGSGLVFENHCPPNTLAANWQRLIMTHLEEKRHRGVLTGAEITDIKISLIGGRAHEKHTEGGDFRQATYRAVRQGLMMAQNVLLEPYYQFRIEVPRANLGHVLTDLNQMKAKFSRPEINESKAVITGYAAVAQIGSYGENLAAFTKGEGTLNCTVRGYEPCENAEEVILEKGYDPEADLYNSPDSVFCSHGAGTVVPWDQVRNYMQLDTGWRFEGEKAEQMPEDVIPVNLPQRRRKESPASGRKQDFYAGEDELRAIFERTYGPIQPRIGRPEGGRKAESLSVAGSAAPRKKKPTRPEEEYLLVDGYNVIFAWKDLNELAQTDLKAARDRLMEILSDYAGYSGKIVILVFDAYRVSGGRGENYRYHNIDVVFTREAETADLYIEKTAHELRRNHQVTVATSDAVEQVIIMGAGALRLSAKNLLEDIIFTQTKAQEQYEEESLRRKDKTYLLDDVPEDVINALRENADGTAGKK